MEVNSDTHCEKFLVKYKSTYLNKRLKLHDHVLWNKDFFQIDKTVLK